MAHRALTLKYRPQVFADVIGQDHVNLVLGRALESGRVAQGYLFAGARGVGKTTTARILAKALNCETRAKAGAKAVADPCNECNSCREVTQGISLDVAEIDGASNRGIADVQSLREKVRFAPTGGHYRVVIIDEVHQLSNDAFAALLKTLEEPPPHLVFIFATTDPQKLPDTIRSRTQRFDFARVSMRKVADRLLEIAKRESKDKEGVQFKLEEGAALLLAHKSEGSMRDAVSALDQVVSSGEKEIDEALVRRVLGLADRESFFAILEGMLGRDPKKALHALHDAFDKGLDAKDLIEGLSEHVRHILILKVDPEGADLVAATGDDLKRLKALGETWSEGDLMRLLRLSSDASFPMRDSAQPLIHLEAAVLQMATLEPGELLGELLARLEALEARLNGGGSPGPVGGSAARTGGATPGRSAPQTAGARASATPPAAPGTTSFAPPPMPRPAAAPVREAAPAPARPAAATVVTPPPERPAAATAAAPAAAAAPAPARSAAPPAARASNGPTATAAGNGASRATAVAPRPAKGDVMTELAAAGLSLVNDTEVERGWARAVAGVNSKKRMLGAFLEESLMLGIAGDTLVLSMDELHRAVIEEAGNQTMLVEEVQRGFGRPLEVRCTAAVAAPPRPVQDADVKPMIDRAIAWFDGDVIERDGHGERTSE
jgi:DNA polymerase-3 subunit gamma/tau